MEMAAPVALLGLGYTVAADGRRDTGMAISIFASIFSSRGQVYGVGRTMTQNETRLLVTCLSQC